VLLITLDTLRADRLGCYGYPRARTPHLDRLAREGVRFEHAFAPAPLTLPSHATLLTGTYPNRHTIRDNGGFFLPAELKTLAELAREKGYTTAAFVSAFVLDSKWRLDRGFETYFDQFDLSRYERISLASVQRVGGETVDEFLTWLGPRAAQPFFAWVHLYDPHAPYQAPEPFGSEFRENPYDGEVAYVDFCLGRILERLDETTLIVIAGDHGEGLGEHGELTHGNFVYDSTLRVPLLFRFPDKRHAGLVLSEPVGLIDVFPTLAETLGATVPAQNQGESLLPLLSGRALPERALFAESLYPRLHYGWSELLSLRSRSFKYIDAPRPELFDWREDHGEQKNLASDREGTLRQLRASLEAFHSDAPRAASPAPVDPETARRLAALGYVGAVAPDPTRHRRDLADPKDKIHLIHGISRADALAQEGELEQAIDLLRQVLAEDPAIVDGHLSLGNKFSEAGRHAEAIASFRRALELQPDYSLALTNLALAYKRARRLDDAEVGFQRVLELDPENRQALFNLGEIYLFKKDYSKARQVFARGLVEEEDSPIFLRQSGIVYYYLGELERAETQLKSSLAARADIDSAHFTLALLYEKTGRLAEAEAEYLAERRLHPDHLRAAFNLARLYGNSGRRAEQIAALEEVVRLDPRWAVGHFHLAKAYRDSGGPGEEQKALRAAERGLELDPESSWAPLGHFIRAEILERMGRSEEAQREAERGKAHKARPR
jgi:choline-sulfatase